MKWYFREWKRENRKNKRRKADFERTLCGNGLSHRKHDAAARDCVLVIQSRKYRKIVIEYHRSNYSQKEKGC